MMAIIGHHVDTTGYSVSGTNGIMLVFSLSLSTLDIYFNYNCTVIKMLEEWHDYYDKHEHILTSNWKARIISVMINTVISIVPSCTLFVHQHFTRQITLTINISLTLLLYLTLWKGYWVRLYLTCRHTLIQYYSIYIWTKSNLFTLLVSSFPSFYAQQCGLFGT